MNLFTEVELLIMASIVGILLLVVIILSICEIISKRKEKNILLEEKLEELEKTDNSILENSMRKIMIKNSHRSYLLCDKSKLGKTYLNTLCHTEELDGIITDT